MSRWWLILYAGIGIACLFLLVALLQTPPHDPYRAFRNRGDGMPRFPYRWTSSPSNFSHAEQVALIGEYDYIAIPGEKFQAIASWYGYEFAFRRTANGETFDPNDLTIATNLPASHLPMGTRVRVTNAETQAAVTARVNDRGPWSNHVSGGQIILHYNNGNLIPHPRIKFDLSQRVAREIGIERAGKGWVIVEVL